MEQGFISQLFAFFEKKTKRKADYLWIYVGENLEFYVQELIPDHGNSDKLHGGIKISVPDEVWSGKLDKEEIAKIISENYTSRLNYMVNPEK